MALWSYGVSKSCDKLKQLYIHYHSGYNHQILQDVNSSGCTLTYKVTWSHLWLLGLEKTRFKLMPLYLHYHSVYCQQTWQDSDLPWGAPTHTVIQLPDHVAFQTYVINQNHHISNTIKQQRGGLGRKGLSRHRLLVLYVKC